MRDVDYNPNRPWYLVTCGDDATTKFWDVRKGGDAPVKTLRSHKHWCGRTSAPAQPDLPRADASMAGVPRVWRARYNRCHDQLVVTSSTDSNVDLWRVASISSAPLLDTDEAECVARRAHAHSSPAPAPIPLCGRGEGTMRVRPSSSRVPVQWGDAS